MDTSDSILTESEIAPNHKKDRNLQSLVDTRAILNPVFCLDAGESMLFTISDPYHYPVYLKDSVMNSNPSFDYG